MKSIHDEIKEILTARHTTLDTKCYLIFKLIGRVKSQPEKVDAKKIEEYVRIGKQVGMINVSGNLYNLGEDAFALTEEGFKRVN